MSDLGSTVPVREGLPANYRMRADAHYVDQLEMRRAGSDEARPMAAPPVTTAPPAPPRPEPSFLSEGDLARSLTSVLSCTDLLADGMPQLTRTVAVDMIRAETQRAICALRTAAVLRQGVADDRRVVTARALVGRMAGLVEADARLRGSRLATAVDVADETTLRVNDETVVSGMAAVVLMMSAGLNDVHGARLDLEATGTEAGRVTLIVRQESVILPDACLKAATARGDVTASPAVAPLVALRQIAEAYGGSLAVTRLPHGTQVAIELPTTAS